jgi:hypothetical protein
MRRLGALPRDEWYIKTLIPVLEVSRIWRQ